MSRIDHPSRDRVYQKALAKRKAKGAIVKDFQSEGQRRDYDRAIRGNDFNIPGMPAFYPAMTPSFQVGVGEGKKAELLPCGHPWKRKVYGTRERYVCRYGHEFPVEEVSWPVT